MEDINIKDLWLYILAKYKIVILIVLICMLLGNIYLFFIQTPLYKSTTKMVLVSEESNIGITTNDVTLNNNLVSTYSEIIKSRAVLNKVIKNLKLQDTFDELANSVTVTSVTNTQLIKVDVSRKSKYEAKKIADEIATVFSDKIEDIYGIRNISVVDKAQIAKSAYNANILKLNIYYLLIGLVVSLGVIFIIFYFDTSIKDGKTIEDKLNLTMFGIVPKVGGKHESK